MLRPFHFYIMGVRNKAIRIAHKKGYRVSECGTVVSYNGRERKLQTKTIKGKEYHRFTVNVEGTSTNIMVHRLQAFQKYGGKSFREGIVVRHKDDDSLNNSRKNILLGTQSQNMQDKYRNQKRK